MDLKLSDRRCLVTGASTGIGRAIALALGAEGARLAIAGRNATSLAAVADAVAALGAPRPEAIVADLATEAGIVGLVAEVAARLGDVQVLVNNAGGSRPRSGGGEPDQAFWDESFMLNFTSARRIAEALAPAMRAARWGRIVNITGAVAQPTVNAATPAKVALLSWAKGLAGDLAPYGITVNNVAPGRINSAQILDRLFPTEAARRAEVERYVPMGRFGEPEELACLVAFLCSDAARYITGTQIPVDGGMYRMSLL